MSLQTANLPIQKPLQLDWGFWLLLLCAVCVAIQFMTGITQFTDELTIRIIFNLVYISTALITVILMVRNVRLASLEPVTRRAWTWLALGMALYGIGNMSFAYLDVVVQERPYPSFADLIYLSSYPIIVIGVLSFPGKLQSQNRSTTQIWLNLALVVCGGALAVWHLSLQPALTGEYADAATASISIAYPLVDLFLFACSILVIYRQSYLNQTALIWFAAYCVLTAVTDLYFAYQTLQGAFVAADVFYTGWSVAMFCASLAAFVQRQDTLRGSVSATMLKVHSILQQVAPYVGVLLGYGVLIFALRDQLSSSIGVVLVGVGLIIVMIAIQQVWDSQNVNRARTQVESARQALEQVNASLEERVQIRTSEVEQALAEQRNLYLALQESATAQEQLMTTIRTLSSPVLPVKRGVLVMPIVGMVDTDRAHLLVQTLLREVEQQRANHVILDVTGIPVIDTAVARTLLSAARCVQLLGAQPMLVGIRPELAQTIVGLGIQLDSLTTRATLQEGIAAIA